MKLIEFLEKFVDITFQKDHQCYAYQPFHLYVETKDNEVEISCMHGVRTVGDCYMLAWKNLGKQAKKVYMAIDYPAFMDVEHDFIAVFEFDKSSKNPFGLRAFPYNNKTGERYPPILKAKVLALIASEFVKAGRFISEMSTIQQN